MSEIRDGRAAIDYAAFAQLGVATVHEAAGRIGIVDLDLTQVVPGSRVAGPARIAFCAPRDNAMAHAVIAHSNPGDVLVLTSANPEPYALIGELMATQAQVRGIAGILVDGAIRDREEIAAMGFPVWARFVRAQGAGKETAGELDVPVVVGGATIRPGDIVIMDGDGAMALPSERAAEVLPIAVEREAHERAMRERYAAGELTYDTLGLRTLFEGG